MAKAPKKFHSIAGKDVKDMLDEIIKEHHKELGRTNFLILFKHGGWESKGRRILGRAKVVGEDLRSTFGKDAIIYLNNDAWHYLSEAQRKYLLDHELYHLDVVKDKNYDTVELSDGRPKLTTVPHDLEDFVEIVKRHGIIMEDVKRLVRVLGDAKQITIDDVNEEQKGLPAPSEEDENQATIDDVMKTIVEDVPDPKVTSISSKRKTKVEKEAEKQAAEQEPFEPTAEELDDDDDLPM